MHPPGAHPAVPPVPILTGPTATGKTALALELARRARSGTPPVELEIINADSLLVYREMNIGTAKPSSEERSAVPHHLIDQLRPDETYTAGQFVTQAHAAADAILARGNQPLIVGGTGFYLKALLFGLWEAPAADAEIRRRLEALPETELYAHLEQRDPQSAYRIGPNDRYRLVRALELLELTGLTPTELQQAKEEKARAEEARGADPRFQLWVIDRPEAELSQRIFDRTREMLDLGLIDEVRGLRERYPDARPLGSVGYAQVIDFLDGRQPAGRKLRPGLDGLKDEIQLATRQLVKSQRTWFKGLLARVPRSRRFELEAERPALLESFGQVVAVAEAGGAPR